MPIRVILDSSFSIYIHMSIIYLYVSNICILGLNFTFFMKLGVLGFYIGATNLGISDPKGS